MTLQVLITTLVVLPFLSSAALAAPEKVCKCRSSKSGSYLEMLTTHDDGRMVISSLESFTVNGPKNASLCQEELKKRAECGGVAPAKVAAPAAAKGVKLLPKQMNQTYYQIGLLPYDEVLTINKLQAKSPKDFKAIEETEARGGRIDIQVQRKETTVDLWFEFPKPGPAN